MIARPSSSMPPRHVFTFDLKNAWICDSVIVDLLVNNASLMLFPGANPASEVFTGPPTSVWVDPAVVGTVDAEPANAGAAVPRIRAMTANSVVVQRVVRDAP